MLLSAEACGLYRSQLGQKSYFPDEIPKILYLFSQCKVNVEKQWSRDRALSCTWHDETQCLYTKQCAFNGTCTSIANIWGRVAMVLVNFSEVDLVKAQHRIGGGFL